jgi:hypothetical protein
MWPGWIRYCGYEVELILDIDRRHDLACTIAGSLVVYCVCIDMAGIKNSREVRPGDTFYTVDEKDKPVANPDYIEPLPGFKPAKSMVY